MTDWWNGLEVIQQIFYYIAVPFTLILLIQSVMSLIGLGGSEADADADTDFDADGDGDFDMDGDADLDGDFDADLDGDFDADLDGDFDAELDMDSDTDFESDEPSIAAAGFRFFTVRGIVAFFCIFGWSGLAFYSSGIQPAIAVILAIVCGFAAMFIIGLMFYSVKRLQSSGNVKYSNAIGKTAEVYIPIPASRAGKGKVMVEVQERLIEAEAVTDEKSPLKTGESVTVIGKIANTLIVKR